MSEMTVDEARDLCTMPWHDGDGYDFDEAVEGFDHMIAEVERAAAVRALEEFAEQWATRDGIEALMFATDDVSAVQITEKALLARAEAYRREGTE